MPRSLLDAQRIRRRPTILITSLVVASLAWLLAQATPSAQLSYAWTFDELRSKSDLIVIAERSATHDTGVKATLTEYQPPFPVVELNTSFRALTVLKGALHQPTVVLRHCRTDADHLSQSVVNGPHALNFTDEQTTVYLLFLKREADGRYSPTSGQVVPDEAVIGLPRTSITLFPR